MSFPGAGAPPDGVEPDLENPEDVLWTSNFVTQGLTIFLVTIFALVRLYAKHKLFDGKFTWDDYTTYFAYILLVGYCVTACLAGVYGAGHNQWEVRKEEIENFYKAGYAATIFYAPMTLCVKLSLLLLIARVFGSVHKKTMWGIRVLIGGIVAYYVSGVFIKIFICWPISAYWRGERDKCMNQSAIITADAIISAISDLAILLLPTPLTWSLQLALKKRLRVIAMLCAGGVATAFSLYRLVLILSEANSQNQSIVFTKVILSGNAEVGIGLICSCLPAVNALYIKKIKGSSYFARHEYQNQYHRSAHNEPGRGDILMTRTIRINTSSKQRGDGESILTAGCDDAALIAEAQQAPRTDTPSRKSDSIV
uniref:Rhodopsin domain-containing protein n=1 Tax=Bionectria ochroleuca TaxID=29856 RepID=A0A8H7NKK7_BIOOC